MLTARLAAQIEVERGIRGIELVGEQIFVALRDRVCVLRDVTLAPVLSNLDVVDVAGQRMLTPAQIVGFDGTRLALPAFVDATASRFLPLPDGGAFVAFDHRDHVAAAAVGEGAAIGRSNLSPSIDGCE